MKQHTLMKSLVAALTVSVAADFASAEGEMLAVGADLTIDRVQQRYPWNGFVDIDYTITGDPGMKFGPNDSLEVLMVDESVSPAITNRAVRFLQAPLPMTVGKHRITWDAHGDGVTNYTDNALFVVSIAHYVPVYMVIDVKGGAATNIYPVSFMNGEPEGGFNFNTDEYKSDKIVLRRIQPGSYMAGSPTNEAARTPEREKQHRVAFSKPFYIGLFEVTQKQYVNVMGNNPSTASGADTRPVVKVSYDKIRGIALTSTHEYDWPAVSEVDKDSFMGRLRAKCKSLDPATRKYTVAVTGFDLPTEFQWEYACRAGTLGGFGTMNAYDNTKEADHDEQLKLLGRFSKNSSDEHGFNTSYAAVGCYNPNPWGLYDMHGNVWEWCRDWYFEDAASLKQYTDPKGNTFSPEGKRVLRGGSYVAGTSSACRSAYRVGLAPSSADVYYGFRLSRTLP